MPTDQLLPIDQIIKQSRKAGLTFGPGDPKIHLAYLTKLRLLPQTIRRKVAGEICGCYPESVIHTLKLIEELKDKGLTYSQIRFRLQNETRSSTNLIDPKPVMATEILENYPSPSGPLSRSPYPLLLSNSNNIAFLLIGLFLGFLIAGANKSTLLSFPTASRPLTIADNTYHLNSDSSELVTLTSHSPTSQGPIYLIAIPNQNLDKLGKVDINTVNSN